MIAPLSWLKEYVDIKLSPKVLGDKLTEIGLGCEKITQEKSDTIFDLEITPNRPDLLSIIGVAREIAALEHARLKFPILKTDLKPKNKQLLPLTIKTNAKINPRFTGIIIRGVTVKESPEWLKKRLEKLGQRSINNIVDVTNYVMLELGNPLHAFDYDKIKGRQMIVAQAQGGELFKSVDGISYHLPKDAVVIKDESGIIDLCGIKGGYNSGTFDDTKNIFIRVPVEVPNLIRRASQSLALRSEASSIFERGVNRGGTIETLKRAVDLVLELAGGEIASNLYDIKSENFEPWELSVRIERLSKILGIEIPQKQVLSILESLNLSPKVKSEQIECTIPTYRNDLKIEEDLIEEVARLYGYNNFPKTLPTGQIPTQTIPYFKNYRIDEKIKNFLISTGFNEIYTYSLVSEEDLESIGINPDTCLRVDNPVSREFEYLRPTLKANLLKALKQNEPNFKSVNLFEIGKVYMGKSIDKAEEHYVVAGISNSKSFYEVKGMLERLLASLGIENDPTPAIEILDEGIFFEMNYARVVESINLEKTFQPLPKFPSVMEDLALTVPEKVPTGSIIKTIEEQSSLIVGVSLLDTYRDSRTFHIIYQSRERNLTSDDTAKVREKILKILTEKYKISPK